MNTSSIRRLLAPLLALFAAPLVDCANLAAIPSGTCGNGVVDDNEDCDTFPAACGKPGTATACRLTCSATSPCPSGWGCSVQGICRQPTGNFDAPGPPGSTGTASMLVGDFDGDGRKDIVGVSTRGSGGDAKLRIAYFGDNAILQRILPLASPVSSVSVRDVDGDGRDDLFAVAEGADILRGRADRTFVPVLFPSFSIPGKGQPFVARQVERPLPGGQSSAQFFVSADPTGNTAVVLLSEGPEFAIRVPEPYATLASPPVWAAAGAWDKALPTAEPFHCGEVYLPFNGANGSRVYVYDLCTAPGGPDGQLAWRPGVTPAAVIPIPPPAKITGRVLLADVGTALSDLPATPGRRGFAVRMADGKLDVVVGTDQGVFVAAQRLPDSNGLIKGLRFDPPGRVTDAGDVDLFDSAPLFVGDLSGDKFADFVFPEGIVYAVPPASKLDRDPADFEVAFTSSRRWTTIAVGHLNADPLVDLALASGDAPDIDVFLGSANGLLSKFSVATSGYARDLEIDDFDGDKAGDIAFIQTRGSREELGVAYGTPTGAPSTPIVAGEIEGVFALKSLGERGGAGQNTLALWLDRGAETKVAALLPSGEREPRAPLLFTDRGTTRTVPSGNLRDWLPIASVLAPVTRAPEANKRPELDIVSLVLGFTYSRAEGRPADRHPIGIWSAGETGALSFALPKETVPLDDSSADDVLATRAASGDLDKPGVDPKHEVVVVKRTRSGASTLSIYRGSKPTAVPLTGVELTVSAAIELRDIDGDGLLDLVLYSGAELARQTYVGFNDGAGGISLPVVPLAIPEDPSHPGETARSVADVAVAGVSPMQPGTTAPRDLLVLTATRLLLMRRTGNRQFQTRDITAASGLTGMSAATGLAVGDFDGDGVEDVAIAEEGAIRILRQIPRLR